jgi:hypothetical protein
MAKRTRKPAKPAQPPAQSRRDLLRDRYPALFARVSILERIQLLQEAHGGEFPPRYVFMHMPDYIINVRRIGTIDLTAGMVAIEVYEHNDIVPGIIWIPFDHVWWIGTTDEAYGVEHAGLRGKTELIGHSHETYQETRLRLAGLPPRPAPAEIYGDSEPRA